MKTVAEIMSVNLATLPKEAYVIEAIKMMFDRKIGAVLIVDGEKLSGILTERDLVNKLYIRGDNPASVRVTDIMTENPTGISPSENVHNAAKFMNDNKFRRLPVLDGKKVVGFISQSDLLKALTEIVIYQG